MLEFLNAVVFYLYLLHIYMSFHVFCRDCGKQVYLGEKINFGAEF